MLLNILERISRTMVHIVMSILQLARQVAYFENACDGDDNENDDGNINEDDSNNGSLTISRGTNQPHNNHTAL